MTRINNPQHSSFISATNTKDTSPTRETARGLPIPASALNILNRPAGRTVPGQTGFDAPVSAQRAQFNMTGEFETPAPRPRSATAAPASGKAPALPDSELMRALNEAHQMVYGNNANGDLKNWLAQARKLANENNNDFNAVKFGLHSELTNAKKGAPVTEGTGPLPQSETTRAIEEAAQMLGGAPAGTDWAARARELAAQPGAKFNDVKFALHGEMLAAKSGRPVVREGQEGQRLPQSEVTRALEEAAQMHGGAPPGTDWAARAKELAALHGNKFDAVKFALHGEMLAAKTGRPVLREGQALPDSELVRALNEAHQMVHGNNANGDLKNWLAQARKLANENNNDFNAVKFGLQAELMNLKKGAPLSEGTGPLPPSETTRAMEEAAQMFGGAPPGTDWAARARQLAAQPGAKFNDVKFGLQAEMLAAKSGRPMLREGQALPPSEVNRALNEAHQMVFGGNVSGRNQGAWMARAQELVALHGNKFDDVKFALQREMMDVKYGK